MVYKLELPEIARIHPMFNVSQLNKVVGKQRAKKELPKDLNVDGPSFWPKRIMRRR